MALGEFLGELLGGNEREQTQRQTSTQTYTPVQSEQIQAFLPQAQAQFEAGTPDISGSQELTQDAVNQYLQAAQSLSGVPQQVAQGQQTLLNAGDPMANPAFQQYAQFLNDELTRSAERLLPRIATEGVMTGTLGQSKERQAKQQLAETLQRQIGGQTSGLISNAYGQGLDAITRGIDATPVVTGAAAGPAAFTETAANLMQGSELLPHQLEQQNLQNYLNVLATNLGGTTTGETESITPVETGGLAGVLGGLSAGAGVANMLPENMAAANPYIMGGTALLGLLS